MRTEVMVGVGTIAVTRSSWIQAGTLFVNRAAGATSGGWPGQQSYAGWKGSGSTNRGGLGPRYVAQFLREQGRNIVKD
jgi:1-pyrroline-5-carboxylate dehydrogenase